MLMLYGNIYISIGGWGCENLAFGSIRGDTQSAIRANGHWGKFLLNAPPFMITNSFCAAQIALSIRHRPIEILPNVIDIKDFDRKRIGIAYYKKKDDDKLNVVKVARLIKSKRVDDFLLAIAKTKRKGIKLLGKVVGDGPERQHLEALACKLGLLSDDVTFLGSRKDIPAILSEADILVHTSLHEGFPNVLLEAMAASLPIITTPAGDAARVVQDGDTGYLIPFRDPDALTKKLIRLANNPDLRFRMGSTGRERVEEKYSFEQLLPNLMAIYTKVAQDTGNQRVLCALL